MKRKILVLTLIVLALGISLTSAFTIYEKKLQVNHEEVLKVVKDDALDELDIELENIFSQARQKLTNNLENIQSYVFPKAKDDIEKHERMKHLELQETKEGLKELNFNSFEEEKQLEISFEMQEQMEIFIKDLLNE